MRIYIDEAGRGPLAGPLYVGLVQDPRMSDLREQFPLFQDSKKLTATQRSIAYQQIQDLVWTQTLKATTQSVSAKIIDRYGVTRALNIAITLGLASLLALPKKEKKLTFSEVQAEIQRYHNHDPITLVIDGKTDFLLSKELGIPTETIVKGDSKLAEIAMASLLAKVERDQYMIYLSEQYPDYDFALHKGYGTQKHYAAIEKYGICDEHRKLFLKQLFPQHQFEGFDAEWCLVAKLAI